MENFVQDSKYVAETISITVPFLDMLQPGDTITGVPVVSITVFAGYDAAPMDILYGGVLVHNHNTVEQRVWRGVTGVIYIINFSISTVAGFTYEKECYLAILPQDGSAVSPIIPFYYTSWPYPIEYAEQMQVAILPTAISMLLNPRYMEQLQVSINPSAFTLTSALIVYSNYPPEQLKVSITPTTFTLTLGLIVYSNYVPEQLQVAILPNSFTLTVGRVDYVNYAPEQLKVSINPTGFTLT